MKREEPDSSGDDGRPGHTPTGREVTVQERTLRIRAELRRRAAVGGLEPAPERRKAPYWSEWWNYWANG